MFETKIKKQFNKTIKMNEMQHLDIGVICGNGEYAGHIVMRTASIDHFEVMDLTDPGVDTCWSSKKCVIEVQLFNPGTEIVLKVV